MAQGVEWRYSRLERIFGCAFELSSMGIRVDEDTLRRRGLQETKIVQS